MKFQPFSDPGRIVAHRGASRLAPENTLAAFRAAAELGVHWIEFDVSMLSDGSLAVHHDDRIDRCSDGTGALGELSAEDLASVDAGAWFSPIYRGERIPMLPEVLTLLDEKRMFANLEIKPHGIAPTRMAQATAEALAPWSWQADRVLVSSFCHETLAELRAIAPDQPIAVLYDEPSKDWVETWRALDAVALHINYRHLSDALVRRCLRESADLRVYTINRPEIVAPFRDLGLSGVITDHPPFFLDQPDWSDWARTAPRAT